MSNTDKTKVEQLSNEETEEAVMALLPTLEVPQLEALYGIISLELKPGVQGNKRSLLKGLRKHLDAIDDDTHDDWQHYVQILDHLTTKEGKKKAGMTANTSTDSNSLGSSTKDTQQGGSTGAGGGRAAGTVDSASVLQNASALNNNVVRFRDYKFGGSIGGEKGLAFSSIQFEIQNARMLRYSDQEIRAGVIRAISPTHELRNYFEMNPDVTLDEMIDMFRSTFVERNSNRLFIDFQKEFQKSDESAATFVTRIMGIRRKVAKLSIEEGNTIDPVQISKGFFHVMFTGLRDGNIRSELRERCRASVPVSDNSRNHVVSMTDNEILRAIADITSIETERNEKLEGDSSKSPIMVEVVDTSKKMEKKEKLNPFVLLEEMKVSHEKDMQQMRSDVTVQLTQIQRTLANINNNNNNNLNGNAPAFFPASNNLPQQNNLPPQNNIPQQNNNQVLQQNSPMPFTYQHFKSSYPGYPDHVVQQHWNNFLQMHTRQQPQSQQHQGRKRGNKCQKCLDENKPSCGHCFKCKKEGHKSQNCTENQ